MLDIHVIHCAEPEPWLLRCLQSLGTLPYRVISGAGRTTAQNRARAIAESTAEFVTWVDPDDWIDAAQIEPILDTLAARPDAAGAFSAEALVDEQGAVIKEPDLSPGEWRPLSQITSPRYAHNLTILRRSAALPHLGAMQPFPALSEYVLKSLATRHGPLLRVPVPAYYWRQHPAQLHRTATTAEHRRAIQLVSPALRAHTSGLTRVAAAVATVAHPARCIACRAVRAITRRTVVDIAAPRR